MAEATTKLKLPLLQGNDLVSKNKINDIVEAIDEKCLSMSHVESRQHWPMWEANKLYRLKDVVKTNTSPTWGFLECTQAGTSDATEPTSLVGEGDTKTDGTTAWILRRLGSIAKHGELSDRQLPDQHPISAIIGLQAALHTHTNKAILDKLTEDVSGRPIYNGELIGVSSDIWGGEYSTYLALSTAIGLSFNTNYVVTADENHNGQRTYYAYLEDSTLKYIGAFSDGTSTGGTTGGGASSSAQWSSSSNIVAGSVKLFAVYNNPTFSFVGPTVLKEELGKSDVVTTVNEFDNGESSSFKFDGEFVQFNGGKMFLQTKFDLPSVINLTNPNCRYVRSTISPTKYKTIEGVTL